MRTETDQPGDALEGLEEQDRVITELLDAWAELTQALEGGDDVDVRWRRGSIGKLLLQHMAVREEAKEVVAARLGEVGQETLAAKLTGDAAARREAIDRLEGLLRGHEAITINTPETVEAVQAVAAAFRSEVGDERSQWLPAAREALGPAGSRGLPSTGWVRRHSPTHPSPGPTWLDRVGPLKALWALYDHLRGFPAGATRPELDVNREHLPGAPPASHRAPSPKEM